MRPLFLPCAGVTAPHAGEQSIQAYLNFTMLLFSIAVYSLQHSSRRITNLVRAPVPLPPGALPPGVSCSSLRALPSAAPHFARAHRRRSNRVARICGEGRGLRRGRSRASLHLLNARADAGEDEAGVPYWQVLLALHHPSTCPPVNLSTRPPGRLPFQALLALNVVTVIFGSQHAVMKDALLSDLSPSALNAGRFALAAALAAPWLPPPEAAGTWQAARELALFTFLGFALQALLP